MFIFMGIGQIAGSIAPYQKPMSVPGGFCPFKSPLSPLFQRGEFFFHTLAKGDLIVCASINMEGLIVFF
jgi:hypothetical protein